MHEECCILWGVKLLHLQRMLLSPLAWRDTGLATLLNEEVVCIWPLGYENPNFNLIPEHVEDCLGVEDRVVYAAWRACIYFSCAATCLKRPVAARRRPVWSYIWTCVENEPEGCCHLMLVWSLCCDLWAVCCVEKDACGICCVEKIAWCCTLHVEFLWLPALKPSFDAALKWLIWRYMLKAAI